MHRHHIADDTTLQGPPGHALRRNDAGYRMTSPLCSVPDSGPVCRLPPWSPVAPGPTCRCWNRGVKAQPCGLGLNARPGPTDSGGFMMEWSRRAVLGRISGIFEGGGYSGIRFAVCGTCGGGRDHGELPSSGGFCRISTGGQDTRFSGQRAIPRDTLTCPPTDRSGQFRRRGHNGSRSGTRTLEP